MRPALLNPLFVSTESMPGIGPKYKGRYQQAVGEVVRDALYRLPYQFIDRRYMPTIPEAPAGQVATFRVIPVKYHNPPRKHLPMKVECQADGGVLHLVFFHAKRDYIYRVLPLEKEAVVSGKIERYGRDVQMIHPDYMVSGDRLHEICVVEPVYSSVAGLPQRLVKRTLQFMLSRLPDLPEWIDQGRCNTYHWSNWQTSMLAVHNEASSHKARQRLAYDELLAHQLAFKLFKQHIKRTSGKVMQGDGRFRNQLLKQLPFSLTEDQLKAVDDITQDQMRPERMMRLLQGDVGCGKTVVALIALLNVVEAGLQGALMAPTEILAKQHYQWIVSQCEPLGLRVGFLSGRVKGKERKALLEELELGHIHILVGTHALFQEGVVFAKLGCVVIDEQHRFGVKQRASLTDKGRDVDVLMMSATPIPRTLTLALYGDMDTTRITTKPKGRKPIDTRVMGVGKKTHIMYSLQQEIKKGRKAYWICPLIEESEMLDLAAVEDRFEELKKIFGSHAGLLHGKMDVKERESVMEAFRDGEIHLLVATTVVEVGVDVPDATIMVIEHAEHFGLSQLHQLRGRVGRNDLDSYCILMYEQLSDYAKKRLSVMRQSNDGFYLAEQDLKLRGGGDVLGVKQSGLPSFRMADISYDFDLLLDAADDAESIMQSDPYLSSDRGKCLRYLLYLFSYDEYVMYLNG